jgi:hypothetical protein
LSNATNHHLDNLPVLQACVDRELDGLPVDHAFYDVCHAELLMMNVLILPSTRKISRFHKLSVRASEIPVLRLHPPRVLSISVTSPFASPGLLPFRLSLHFAVNACSGRPVIGIVGIDPDHPVVAPDGHRKTESAV